MWNKSSLVNRQFGNFYLWLDFTERVFIFYDEYFFLSSSFQNLRIFLSLKNVPKVETLLNTIFLNDSINVSVEHFLRITRNSDQRKCDSNNLPIALSFSSVLCDWEYTYVHDYIRLANAVCFHQCFWTKHRWLYHDYPRLSHLRSDVGSCFAH